VRYATWNVNSLKARLPLVERWVSVVQPDVLCLQETKLADEAFPTEFFAELGYESARHGNGPWNGVAIVSRVGLADVVAGFPDDLPGSSPEARLIRAKCGSVVVICVYVPNGRTVGSEHYEAKLEFLGRLVTYVASTSPATAEVLLCGDFNVAPADADVFDPAYFEGSTHVTAAERDAVGKLVDLGFEDTIRRQYPDTGGIFSWWDYRAGNFHKGRGMRIDLMLASRPLASRVEWALIDRNGRRGQGSKTEPQPSDHTPVIVQTAE
jgi:exodeoxyribonuclease-3